MKLIKIIFVSAATILLNACNPPSYVLESPDGNTRLELSDKDGMLSYSVTHLSDTVLCPSAVSLKLQGGRILGRTVDIAKVKFSGTVSESIDAPFYRQSTIAEKYKGMTVDCADYAIEFRAYNSGIAYRFITRLPGGIKVEDEDASFIFPDDNTAWVAHSGGKSPMTNSFQLTYSHEKISEFGGTDALAILPLVVECGNGTIAMITESDLRSYPGMFLSGTDGGYKAKFANYPDSSFLHPTRCQKKILSRKAYIAQTDGSRTFPWRILILAEDAKALAVNNLVYCLAEPSRLDDTSWIEPGKVAWEWWNDWGLTDVPFKPGINNETYKYYIDFADKFGLEYVILDEGWSAKDDIMSVKKEIDLPRLVQYGRERGVRLILWAVANVLDEKLETACDYYGKLGVAGFKIDFIDRDDQEAQDLIYRIAGAAAGHKMIIDIHGTNKPCGLNRTYPNIINFEGVYGLEELKWSNPDMPSYDVTFPFIRQVNGPSDYTAGSYLNASREGFEINYHKPQSQGTRAHQAATYVVFDAPLTMMCDSPSLYLKDPVCTEFIAGIPTCYDSTEILAGEIGEYIVSCRKLKGKWYIGALTDWNPRSLKLELQFLAKGKEYTATVFRDTELSDKKPTSYAIDTVTVSRDTPLEINMACGGGSVIIIEEKNNL